jgi:hypothetical protein
MTEALVGRIAYRFTFQGSNTTLGGVIGIIKEQKSRTVTSSALATQTT